MALSFENPKEYITEIIGTMILVAIGCIAGSVTVNGNWWGYGAGTMSVGAAFALAFIGLIYCIGKYSNCHFNPLISLSMFISGKMKAVETLWYVLAQLIGGIIGAVLAFLVLGIAYDTWNIFLFPSTYGGYFGGAELVGAIIIEFLLAFFLSYVTMKATDSGKIGMKSGAVIAVAIFGLIWIFGGMTYSAMNPAKSVGAAIAMLFSGIENHYEPIIQLWLFIIFPALGAVVGTFIYMIMESGEFDLNKYISAVKKNKSEDADDAEYSEEAVEETAEEPAAEETVDEPEEIPEIESEEEDALPEVESVDEESVPEIESEEKIAEDSETKTE